MNIEKGGNEPSQEINSRPLYIKREVEVNDGYGNVETQWEDLEVDSEEIKRGAEALLDKFKGWITLERAVKLAKTDSVTLENWVQTELIPARDKELADVKANWLEYQRLGFDGGTWEDYYAQQKSFWEKAGYPLE